MAFIWGNPKLLNLKTYFEGYYKRRRSVETRAINLNQ